MWSHWSMKSLNCNLIVNSHCASGLASCHCNSHLQNGLQRELQTSEPGCFHTWEDGKSVFRKKAGVGETTERERNHWAQINTVLLRKHQCGSCKGKSCFINLLELQKGDSNYVDKIWSVFSNCLWQGSMWKVIKKLHSCRIGGKVLLATGNL